MTDPRKQLAKLNPTNVRFDVGMGGGKPEFVRIDVAGALGYMDAGLPREVFEACWNPDGARLHRHKLKDAVVALVAPELKRQRLRLSEAHLDLQLAEAAVAWSRAASHEQRREVEQRRERLAVIRAETWPQNVMEQLPALTDAAIGEIARFHKCEQCEGRCFVIADELVTDCPACLATGFAQAPDLQRAHALDEMDSRNFVRNWKPVYLWLLGRFRSAELKAREQFEAVAA